MPRARLSPNSVRSQEDQIAPPVTEPEAGQSARPAPSEEPWARHAFEPIGSLTPEAAHASAQHFSRIPPSTWRWPHFAPAELACRGDGLLWMDERALDALEAVRRRLGVPLIVTSAYRSPEHNRRVGGARASQHLLGRAFDIRCDNIAAEALIDAALREGFRGIGTYPDHGFVHIDFREKPARWGRPFPPREDRFGEDSVAAIEKERVGKTAATTAAAGAGVVGAGAGATGALDASVQGGWLTPDLLMQLISYGVPTAAAVVLGYQAWATRRHWIAWLMRRRLW